MEEVLTFFIAILLGALIGLQREYEQQHTHIKRFAGLRTFIIITLMGAILGYITHKQLDNFLLVTVGLISITAFSIMCRMLMTITITPGMMGIHLGVTTGMTTLAWMLMVTALGTCPMTSPVALIKIAIL